MHPILRHLRRAALLSAGEGPSDAQLLDSFLDRREEAAFEALVRRHGPMVLSVCRRVAGNVHDADDAFQATFLVLVRKAASLRSRHLLAGWLYGVAYRTALKARCMNHKRRVKEQQAADRPQFQPNTDGPPEELLARLDEELNRLPDRYRLPVVLCELQGHSRKEAAQMLGLPEGTLSWRLAHARKLLAQRLARYGTMLSAGAVAAALSESAASAVPAGLVQTVTIQALTTGTVPAPVQALIEGVLKVMLLSKLKIVWGVALAAVVGVGAVGLIYRPAVAADPNQPGSGGRAARATENELEELRLEIAALRKGLQATRERVRTLEDQVATLQAQRRGPGGMMRGGIGMGGGMGGRAGVMGGMAPGMGGGAGVMGGMAPTMGKGGSMSMMGGMGVMSGGMRGGGVSGIMKGGMPGGGMMGGAMMQMMGGAKGGAAGKGVGASKPQGETKPHTGKGGAGEKPGAGTSSGATKADTEARQRLDEARVRAEAKALLDQLNARLEERTTGNPLAAAKAALKRLSAHPNDKRAVDELERALKQLEAEHKH